MQREEGVGPCIRGSEVIDYGRKEVECVTFLVTHLTRSDIEVRMLWIAVRATPVDSRRREGSSRRQIPRKKGQSAVGIHFLGHAVSARIRLIRFRTLPTLPWGYPAHCLYILNMT